MPNDKNKQTVKDLTEKISKSKAVVFTDYSGLSSNAINQLRQSMKDNESEVIIAKNTLMKLALEKEKIDTTNISKDLEGTTAVIFANKDAVASIKALFEFIKKGDLPKIKSAFFEGQYATADKVEIISKLPSREQLLSQIVGGLKSPLSGIVRTFNGVQSKFVFAIAQIAKKKEGGVTE